MPHRTTSHYVFSAACKTTLYVCFAVVVSLWFAYQSMGHLTGTVIDGDGAQNARIAYHLVHTGVLGYAEEETPNPRPWMRREPLPILALSALLLLHPSFGEPYKIADLLDGRLTKTIKLVNVFWLFLAAFLIFLLCRELFSSPIAAGIIALVSLFVSNVSFFSVGSFVDRLYTELAASTLLLAASWCAVRFVRSETKARALCLGVAMGLLALTKAAFFYVGIVLILLLFILDRLKLISHPDAVSLRRLRISYAVLVTAFLATLTPWVMRNAINLGSPGITSRAERVLGLRMLLAEQPTMGLVYAWSPKPIKQKLGPVLGYSPEDLKMGEIGRHHLRQRAPAANIQGENEGYWI